MKKSDIISPGRKQQSSIFSPVLLSLTIFILFALCVAPAWAENISGENQSGMDGDELNVVSSLLNSNQSNESETAPLSTSLLVENTSEVSNETTTTVPATLLQSTAHSPTGGVITATDDVFLRVANDAGVHFNDFGNNTFHILWTGGGLNSLHISNSSSSIHSIYTMYGEPTTTSAQSGTFYVTTTGGRGYQDDIFLCVAVNGTIPDEFRLHLVAEGCQWTPCTTPRTIPPSSAITYNATTLDEWFTKDDLTYGPQTWRPAVKTKYPLYYGQNVGDTSNQFSMMFIDLNGGILSEYPLEVRYEFQNLNTSASFNVYGYAQYPDKDKTRYVNSWTNCLTSDSDISGWYVSGVPLEPPARVNISSSDIELPINGKKIFTATAYDIYDEAIDGAVFSWTSSNTTVGTIDQNGLFTPKELGETEIRVTCMGGASDSVQVTVVPEVPIVLDSIGLSPSSLDLYTDDTRTYRLNATGYDQFGDPFPFSAYTWSSTNETVCTVNATGFVSLVGVGNATISASNSGISGTAPVTISVRPDWTLDLIGAVNRTLNRTEFIDLAKAHPASYTDNKGNVWEGVDLSVLIGLVDDNDPATLNQVLANDLYRIFVTSSQVGGDNCSIVTSDELLGDKTFVVAYILNGEEIPDKTVSGKLYWPLRMHGSGCAVNSRSLAQVTKIEFAIRPHVSAINISEMIQAWDNDSTPISIPIHAYDDSGAVLSDTKYVLDYVWTSSNESVGVVDEDGNFLIKGAGRTQIAAQLGDKTTTIDAVVYSSAENSHRFYVDETGATGFKTIAEALEFARDGDVIVVKNGTYAEALDVDKAVTIRSENGSSGVIIPAKVDINADNVSLEGLTVNNCVNVNSGFRDCVIDHCVVDYYSKYSPVIYLQSGSSNCTVSNSTVINTGASYAIELAYSSDNLIINNSVEAINAGIEIFESSSSILKDNDIQGPFWMVQEHDSIFENNTIKSSTFLFYGYDCQNVTVVNNTMVANGQYAVYLSSVTGSKFCNNRISGGTTDTLYAYNSVSSDSIYLNEISGTAGKLIYAKKSSTLNSIDPVTYVYHNNTYTGIIGNHYSDYTGNDTNGDGIGDTPYTGKKITDSYPLVSPIDAYLVLTPTTITVTPPAATLEVDESVTFMAEVFDQRGEEMPGAVPVWSSSNTTLGVVNATTGCFEALSPGEMAVTAGCGDCTASALVTVVPATKKTETVSFEVPDCTFAENSSGTPFISVNASAASINGSRLALQGDGFTLTVMTTSMEKPAGGRINATYDGMVLEIAPLVADLPIPGNVSGSIRANLTGLPAGAGITTTLSQNITDEAMAAFQLAASGDGLKVKAVAFTMNIRKTNLANGQEIANASVRMAVSPAWVEAHGGVGAVRIIRWAEDGTKEVLTTVQVGTDPAGNLVFEAVSPNGLSIFGLAAVASTDEPATSSSSSSSGGGSSDVAAISGSIPAGESQTFAVSKTAVTRITVGAYDTIDDMLVTVQKASLSKDMAAPTQTTYEIVETTLYRADPSAIGDVTLEFAVPTSWIQDHGLSTANIVLLGYENEGWKPLKTTFVKEENGQALYSAEADGFTYFAIVSGEIVAAGAPVPAEETTVPSTTGVVQTTGTSTPPATTTAPRPTPLTEGIALLAIGAAAVMMRRR